MRALRQKRWWWLWRPAASLAILAALAYARAGPRGVVTDAAGLLDQAERASLARQHGALLRDLDIDYRVDVVAGADDLLGYGVRRFSELGVGGRSASGHGLLLVLDPARDRVRLEVGQSLEGAFPDAFVAYLEQRQMLPFFRAGRVGDGVLAATELLVTRAQRERQRGGFAGPARPGAAGAGAETRAALGAGDDGSFRDGPDVAPGETPRATVAAYLAAMSARNGNAALALYTPQTREFLEQWVVTPGQMDSVASTYRSCRAEPVRVDAAGGRAVVRYPVEARHCAPWLLVREGERWQLDLATASRILRFGAGNAWHFAPGVPHPYGFAFEDWRLDRRGFPHPG